MQNSLLLSIVAGGVAGLVGAGAVSLVLLDSEPAPAETDAAVGLAAPTGDGAAAQEGLERLRTETAMLANRLEALEAQTAALAARQSSARQAVEAEPDPAVARLEDQMRQLLLAMSDPETPIPPALAESVRGVYDDIRDEEQAERDARRAEAREMELNARMERYTVKLGLDEYQSNEMRVILADSQAKRDRLVADAREGGTWIDMREEMRAVHDEAEAALGNLLTADQLERLQELDGGRLGPPGGRRFGGDDGGGRRGRR